MHCTWSHATKLSRPGFFQWSNRFNENLIQLTIRVLQSGIVQSIKAKNFKAAGRAQILSLLAHMCQTWRTGLYSLLRLSIGTASKFLYIRRESYVTCLAAKSLGHLQHMMQFYYHHIDEFV